MLSARQLLRVPRRAVSGPFSKTPTREEMMAKGWKPPPPSPMSDKTPEEVEAIRQNLRAQGMRLQQRTWSIFAATILGCGVAVGAIYLSTDQAPAPAVVDENDPAIQRARQVASQHLQKPTTAAQLKKKTTMDGLYGFSQEYEVNNDFCLIVSGRYAAVVATETSLEIRPGHHLSGAIFRQLEPLRYDDKLVCVDEAGRLALVPEIDSPSPEVYVTLEDHPHRDGYHVMVHNGRYLSSDLAFQPNIGQALLLQEDRLEMFPNHTAPVFDQPVLDPSHLISANGVDVYHPDASFRLRQVNKEGAMFNAADEGHMNEHYTGASFDGNDYKVGPVFRLEIINGNTYLCADEKYLGIGFIYPRNSLPSSCQHHTSHTRCNFCSSNYGLMFFTHPPEHNVQMVPVAADTFILYDGMYYYAADYVKASVGFSARVDRDSATRFQFVSI
ncbi:hypothetical protein RI367_005079 [Sorochytrium milnesiophthora]